MPTCAKCLRRLGTVRWVGDGNALSAVHGLYQWWCQVCALTAQLEHAKELAASIPRLEMQLAEAQRDDVVAVRRDT